MESAETDQRQFCLKWNNHPTNISTVFDRLRMEELFVDVTLATQDKQVLRAHRVILSAGSGYLESVLSDTDTEHPTIVLCNIQHRDLKLLVDFMYTGEIAVDQQQFQTLLDAAKSLKIKGLYEDAEDNLTNGDLQKEEDSSTFSELSIKSKYEIQPSKSTLKRGRSHSEESEEEPIESPTSVKDEEDISQDETPAKVLKSMYGPFQGVSNPFWMMSQKNGELDIAVPQQNQSSQPTDVVPNLMNLVSQTNLLQSNAKSGSSNAQHNLNKQFLQAMQNVMCTNPYLNPMAAMQKPLDLLSPNFSPSFPAGLSPNTNTAQAKTSSPNSKSGILSSSSAPVRRYKQYSEDSLQAALKEIVNGQSINRSSMKHNIPARTLRDWMKRLNIKSVFTHHSHNKERTASQETDQESSASGSPDPRTSELTSPVFEASTGPLLFSSPKSVFPGMKMAENIKSEEEIDDDEPKPLRIDEKSINGITQIAQKAN